MKLRLAKTQAFLGRWYYSIGSLFQLLCLLRCVLWPNGAKYAYSVYRTQIGMWGWQIEWYRFQCSRFTLTPQMGGIILHWNSGHTAADRAQLCIERLWEVVGELLIGATPDSLNSPKSPLTPKIGISKIPLLTIWIDRRCEVMVVANLPKYSVNWHYVLPGKKFVQHIGDLSPTICWLFSIIREAKMFGVLRTSYHCP